MEKTTIYHTGGEATPEGRVGVVARIENKSLYQSRRCLDCFALVVLTQGQGRLESGEGAVEEVGEGDAWVLFPGLPHEYGPNPGETWTEWYVLFEGKSFERWQESGLLDAEHPRLRKYPVDLWTQGLKALSGEGLSGLQRVCRLQALLADVTAGRKGEEDWLLRARRELEGRLTEPDAVRSAAKAMGMSYQVFRKRFRTAEGQPPGAYLRGRVQEVAARRLLTGEESIKQIAEDLGFCDEFHFTRRFRACHGVPPASYRRRFPKER